MKIKSTFALLDVLVGRSWLNKRIPKGSHDMTEPVRVIIHGSITGRWGDFDGTSQDFTVDVERVEVVA